MPDLHRTWSALTPANTQVLICDLQETIVARSRTTVPKALAQSAGVLAQIAELFGLPLTFSVVPEGKGAPKLIAPLKPFATRANQFLRANANPFLEPKSREQLASAHRRTLILAGFSTETVILQAALSAIERGQAVLIAIDASGGLSERTENAALTHLRDAGAIISSVVSIATALSPDFTTEKGQKMFEIVQTLRLA